MRFRNTGDWGSSIGKADSWRVPTTVLAGAATLYMSNKVLPRQNDPFLKASGNVGIL
jgi:hypothetical protein